MTIGIACISTIYCHMIGSPADACVFDGNQAYLKFGPPGYTPITSPFSTPARSPNTPQPAIPFQVLNSTELQILESNVYIITVKIYPDVPAKISLHFEGRNITETLESESEPNLIRLQGILEHDAIVSFWMDGMELRYFKSIEIIATIEVTNARSLPDPRRDLNFPSQSEISAKFDSEKIETCLNRICLQLSTANFSTVIQSEIISLLLDLHYGYADHPLWLRQYISMLGNSDRMLSHVYTIPKMRSYGMVRMRKIQARSDRSTFAYWWLRDGMTISIAADASISNLFASYPLISRLNSIVNGAISSIDLNFFRFYREATITDRPNVVREISRIVEPFQFGHLLSTSLDPSHFEFHPNSAVNSTTSLAQNFIYFFLDRFLDRFSSFEFIPSKTIEYREHASG